MAMNCEVPCTPNMVCEFSWFPLLWGALRASVQEVLVLTDSSNIPLRDFVGRQPLCRLHWPNLSPSGYVQLPVEVWGSKRHRLVQRLLESADHIVQIVESVGGRIEVLVSSILPPTEVFWP